MKKEYQQKRTQGFTIIEVLIVLAIAALILLIVFLAVPALQRNSRNTSRRADVSNMLASINEFASNNNGRTPDTVSGTTTLTWSTVAAGATTAETKLNYYTKGASVTASPASGSVGLQTSTPAGGVVALPNSGGSDFVVVYEGGDCDPATPGAIKQGGARSVAAQYLIENGSNKYTGQCLSS